MARVDASYSQVRAEHRLDTEAAMQAVFDSMKDDVAARFGAGAATLIAKKWTEALSSAMLERQMATASDIASRVADALGAEGYDPEVMREWLTMNANLNAQATTSHMEDDIRAAADREDVDAPVDHVFGIMAAGGTASLSVRMVTTAANFGARDAAEKSGAAVKVWRTTSSKPRKSHARMNGESVALDEKFSNGLMWPGDPEGDASETAECKCALSIIK